MNVFQGVQSFFRGPEGIQGVPGPLGPPGSDGMPGATYPPRDRELTVNFHLLSSNENQLMGVRRAVEYRVVNLFEPYGINIIPIYTLHYGTPLVRLDAPGFRKYHLARAVSALTVYVMGDSYLDSHLYQIDRNLGEAAHYTDLLQGVAIVAGDYPTPNEPENLVGWLIRHELGHLLGLPHVPGTFMDERASWENVAVSQGQADTLRSIGGG